MSTAPRILARACANFAGLRFGDIVPVDPDDPYMRGLLDAEPPLLVAVDVIPAVSDDPALHEDRRDLSASDDTVAE